MKPYDTHIFLTSTLLRFDKPSCAIQADDQAASDLGIQSSAMSGFLDPVYCQRLCLVFSAASSNLPEHALNPRDHLMTGRIARFVEVDHTRANVGFEIALERIATHRNWREMPGSDEEFIVIF